MQMVTGIVCVLDALGTKGIWSIDEPEIYLTKLRAIHDNLSQVKEYVNQLQTPLTWNFNTFSDTIIITTHWGGIENETMIPIMARAIDGLFSHCLAQDLLMRGAMSYGKFIQENNIIVGPAIDDAAQWHDKAQLVGCLLTPNTTLLYDCGLDRWNRNPYESYDYSQYGIKYKTPCKGNLNYDVYQVNWPLSYAKALIPLGKPSLNLRLKETLGKYPIPAEAFNKHENTLAFFEYSLAKSSLDQYL